MGGQRKYKEERKIVTEKHPGLNLVYGSEFDGHDRIYHQENDHLLSVHSLKKPLKKWNINGNDKHWSIWINNNKKSLCASYNVIKKETKFNYLFGVDAATEGIFISLFCNSPSRWLRSLGSYIAGRPRTKLIRSSSTCMILLLTPQQAPSDWWKKMAPTLYINTYIYR